MPGTAEWELLLLYVVGTGSGTIPTLYSVGFNAGGLMNGTPNATTAASQLAQQTVALTEYLQLHTGEGLPVPWRHEQLRGDDNGGGTAGCVMSLDITSGFPTVDAATLFRSPPTGGTSGIIIDNVSILPKARAFTTQRRQDRHWSKPRSPA